MLSDRSLLPDVAAAGPALFAGDATCLTVALLTGLRVIRRARPLLIVDGSNAFDPFLVADLAQKSGLAPRALLDQIRISRVFTCHQLEALLRGRLQAAVRQFDAPAVYFSGLLDPLLDEEVAAGEAFRIFRLIPPAMRGLAASGIAVVVACPPPQSIPGREGMFASLCEAAAWVFRVARAGDADGAVRIACTKPTTGTWTWEPQIGMVVPRRWW